MDERPGFGLYVHWPFCQAKCPYCDFNSHSLKSDLPAAEYVDALLTDLHSVAAAVAGREVISIFMGGGTPSLFPALQLGRLLQGIANQLTLLPDAEITLEANPGAVEHAAFGDYRAAGINRLTLGVQSFADSKLQKLGRIHTAADARTAFREARAAGFDNINLDLMYALPGQSLEQACDDIERAVELGAAHVSWYQLTLEPNTVFYSRPPADLPQEDDVWEIQSRGEKLLAETVTASHTARTGEAFMGATRLRLAIEGAARENIRLLLARLQQLDIRDAGLSVMPIQ